MNSFILLLLLIDFEIEIMHMLDSRFFFFLWKICFNRQYYIFFLCEHIKYSFYINEFKIIFLFDKNNFIQFQIQKTYICHIFCTQKSDSSRNQIFVYKIYGKCTFPEFETNCFKIVAIMERKY